LPALERLQAKALRWWLSWREFAGVVDITNARIPFAVLPDIHLVSICNQPLAALVAN